MDSHPKGITTFNMLKQKLEWKMTAPDDGAVSAIAAELAIPRPIARAIYNRGITTVEAASQFAAPSAASVHDPFLLNDMDIAVERAEKALEKGERILILGDYDVDGISGTSLLVSFLREIGGNVNYYIPNRESEGYGLSAAVVKKCAVAGYGLIITVDSGVTAIDEADIAAELGLDLIIIDHHQPHETLPKAAALINPKRADSTYPFRDLAGVGVAFKFITAMGGRRGMGFEELLERYSELVALGTIADLVGLLDENRMFVTAGLSRMGRSTNHGIKALIQVAKYREDDRLDTYLVSFGLAPRINAAGRVWTPRAGVELLLTDSPAKAAQLAGKLDEHNRARIAEESDIFKEADTMLKESGILQNDRTIVLFHENWNVGIIGIVASRLIERHYMPAILITQSLKPEECAATDPVKGRICQGSVRSIKEVNIYEALSKCQDILISFGGHQMAAGLKIYENDIPVLRERLNGLISGDFKERRFRPSVTIDDELDLNIIDMEMLNHCHIMEPCGAGNARPVFMATGVPLLELNPCGADGKHLRMRLGRKDSHIDAIGFSFGTTWPPHSFSQEKLDIVFTIKEDNFRNKKSVKLHLIDLRSSAPA